MHWKDWARFPPSNFQGSEVEDWSLTEKAKAQEQILGLSVNIHPLELVKDQLAVHEITSSADAGSHVGESIVIAGLKLSSHRAKTGKGENMLFMSLEDLEGMVEVVFFSQVYNQNRQLLRSPGPYLIRGVVEKDEDEGDYWLRVEKVKQLTNQ